MSEPQARSASDAKRRLTPGAEKRLVDLDDLEAVVNLVERLKSPAERAWYRLPESEREAFDRVRGIVDADYR